MFEPLIQWSKWRHYAGNRWRLNAGNSQLPIQAADLWAWCLRKNTDDPGAKSFEWLLEEMPNVSQSNYCNYYDLERMSSVLEESARIAQGGQVPSELMSIYEIISSKKK